VPDLTTQHAFRSAPFRPIIHCMHDSFAVEGRARRAPGASRAAAAAGKERSWDRPEESALPPEAAGGAAGSDVRSVRQIGSASAPFLGPE